MITGTPDQDSSQYTETLNPLQGGFSSVSPSAIKYPTTSHHQQSAVRMESLARHSYISQQKLQVLDPQYQVKPLQGTFATPNSSEKLLSSTSLDIFTGTGEFRGGNQQYTSVLNPQQELFTSGIDMPRGGDTLQKELASFWSKGMPETFDPQYCEIAVKQGMQVYICKFGECRRVISGKCQFERHLRTHTGEKPFHCQYCSYKSSRKGNLKVHTLKMHPQAVSGFE